MLLPNAGTVRHLPLALFAAEVIVSAKCVWERILLHLQSGTTLEV